MAIVIQSATRVRVLYWYRNWIQFAHCYIQPLKTTPSLKRCYFMDTSCRYSRQRALLCSFTPLCLWHNLYHLNDLIMMKDERVVSLKLIHRKPLLKLFWNQVRSLVDSHWRSDVTSDPTSNPTPEHGQLCSITPELSPTVQLVWSLCFNGVSVCCWYFTSHE